MTEMSYSLSKLLRFVLYEVARQATGHGRNRTTAASFSEDPEALHTVFYRIQRKYSAVFPPLREMHFITAGSHPYSSELTEALDRLQAAGAISRLNPSFEKFSRKSYHDTPERMKLARKTIVGDDKAAARALKEIVGTLQKKILIPQAAGAE